MTQTLLRSRKPKREDLPKDANLCEFCSAKCCKYIALPIDTPETREDFDNLRWYIMHGSGTINVFVEEDQWYLMIHQACQHLLPDNRCGVYHTRHRFAATITPTIVSTTTTGSMIASSKVPTRFGSMPRQSLASISFPPRDYRSWRKPPPEVVPLVACSFINHSRRQPLAGRD